MTCLTFYGGVREIGGNKILLEDKGTKLFLDFGMSFGRRQKFFEEYLKPRAANGIGDFFAMGLIPDVPGIYREDLLEHYGRKGEEVDVQAVLLTHAHADHANYISFLHKDIPVYCGETCKYILEAVEEQGQREIENEILGFKKRPIYKNEYKNLPIKRRFKTFRTGDKFKIDSLEIEPIHNDHSVPGSYGYIVHTSEGSVVYTGDLRMHGTHAEMTGDFVKAARESKPVALITEGTRINIEESNESEQNVYNESREKILKNNKLSIIDFNFKDVDRFRTFYKIAKDLGKKLVISFKHSCFLDKYHYDKKLRIPSTKDEHILILKPKRLTGTYIDEDYTDNYIKKRLNYPNITTAEEIKKSPSKYMVVLNFWYFNIFVDLNLKGGVYVHSLSEPFNEEMEITYKRMINWINYFDLDLFQSHCSGHIFGRDLKDIIYEINPKTLFPIHTEKPGLFRKLGIKSVMVKYGINYKIKTKIS